MLYWKVMLKLIKEVTQNKMNRLELSYTSMTKHELFKMSTKTLLNFMYKMFSEGMSGESVTTLQYDYLNLCIKAISNILESRLFDQRQAFMLKNKELFELINAILQLISTINIENMVISSKLIILDQLYKRIPVHRSCLSKNNEINSEPGPRVIPQTFSSKLSDLNFVDIRARSLLIFKQDLHKHFLLDQEHSKLLH